MTSTILAVGRAIYTIATLDRFLSTLLSPKIHTADVKIPPRPCVVLPGQCTDLRLGSVQFSSSVVHILTRVPKLKHTRLEALAFQAIKSSLSESNILDEAFSWFTAQYGFLFYPAVLVDCRLLQVFRHSTNGVRTTPGIQEHF